MSVNALIAVSRKWTRAGSPDRNRLDPCRYRSVTGGRPGRGDAVRPPCVSLEPHVSTVRSAPPTGPSRWSCRHSCPVRWSSAPSPCLRRCRPPRPLHASGRTANGEWVLDVPADFNGTLLVWSHGYTFTPVPGSNAPSTAVRDALLGQGYALVGSSYARGGAGWAVREGVRAGVEALGIAKRRIGADRVDTVVAWGASLGGLITQTLAERRPEPGGRRRPAVRGPRRDEQEPRPGPRRRGRRQARSSTRSFGCVASRAGRPRRPTWTPPPKAILGQLSDPDTQAAATGRMLALAALSGVRREDEDLQRRRHQRSCRGGHRVGPHGPELRHARSLRHRAARRRQPVHQQSAPTTASG